MSLERTGSRTGLPYKVRWKHAGVHRARRFATAAAADKFDRKVKDLRAAGELHLLDEEPRAFFRSWLSKLATAIFIKALYSLVIAIVLAVSAALAASTDSLGFLLAFGLQTAFFWAIL